MKVVVIDIASGSVEATLESSSAPQQEEPLELGDGRCLIVRGRVWAETADGELEVKLHTQRVDFSDFFVAEEAAAVAA